jgi:hypothetical protein
MTAYGPARRPLRRSDTSGVRDKPEVPATALHDVAKSAVGVGVVVFRDDAGFRLASCRRPIDVGQVENIQDDPPL